MNSFGFTYNFAVLFTTLLTTIYSQDYCVSEKVLNNANFVFTSYIQGVGEDFNKTDSKSKCIHFYGFPNKMKVCGEIGLRYKLKCDNQCGINSRFWLKYYSENREIQYESIEPSVANEWNHWNNTICAEFQYGVKLFTQTAANMHLVHFVLFINPKDISDAQNFNATKLIDLCHKENMEDANICHPDVQHFGWMVTAIIMIIVTVGSFILVISLSVTMPYSVWDKPKIQRMPVRR